MKFHTIPLLIIIIIQINLHSQNKANSNAIVTNKSGLKIYSSFSLSSQVVATVPHGSFITIMHSEIKVNNLHFHQIYWNNFFGYCNGEDFIDVGFYPIIIDMPMKLLNEYHIGIECEGCTNSEWEGSIRFDSIKKECVYKEIIYFMESEYESETKVLRGSYKIYNKYLLVTFIESTNYKTYSRTKITSKMKISKITKSYKFYPAKSYCYGNEYKNNLYAPDFKGPNYIFGMKCE